MGEHRDANLAERDAKNSRWPNMYGDLNALPDVTNDMVGGADPRPIKWTNYNTDKVLRLKMWF